MKTGDYETVYKHWEKRLSNGASENWLAGLENSIIEWQKSADVMDKKLFNEGHLFSEFEKVDFRKHIRQRRALVETLKGLLAKYEKINEPQVVEVKPKDKEDWIKSEYENNRNIYTTDTEWAEATAVKFKKEFNTSLGDAGSMKRYGKYKGLN